ncbi:ferritin-like domain-containing protein [Paraliomyxa miuraensis]|uniref:ferritin-like domain-containing protein n=1 Tax=Paraliomyxa miuraensis TaxID=376150 RepID=UPI0022511B94|nr:ferritin-like domain-containing protein [Paraliomyxa miuraensis]MCX4247146.1 ferritin-like domain-containing protein [Paraliomyxa miuraensis]
MTDSHEPPSELPAQERDLHRALLSLREELEAVDWYQQRVVLCGDDELASVLAHNRDEEIEHAAMTLEWLRRRVPAWDRCLRRFLFTEGPISRQPPAPDARVAAHGLGIGGLGGGRAP